MMTKERKLTGWHAFGIFGGAFAVIIAVNIALAYNAVRTFPGLEVKNTYVASQEFNEKRTAQEALGWDVQADAKGGLVWIEIKDEAGRPVQVGQLEAVIGRATHVQDDQSPEFTFDGKAYVARAQLSGGNWNIRMKATSLDGTPFEQRIVLNLED